MCVAYLREGFTTKEKREFVDSQTQYVTYVFPPVGNIISQLVSVGRKPRTTILPPIVEIFFKN